MCEGCDFGDCDTCPFVKHLHDWGEPYKEPEYPPVREEPTEHPRVWEEFVKPQYWERDRPSFYEEN